MSGLLGAWQSEPLPQHPQDESCPQRPGPGPEPVRGHEAAMGRVIEPVGKATVEGPLHEPGGEPDER